MNEIYEKNFIDVTDEPVSEKVFLNLVKLSQIYRRAINASNESFDLSPNELGLLMIMYLYPSVDTANQIVKILGTTKGLASRNIDNLTKKGLIKTTPDEKDRRVVRLSLCDRAKGLCEDIRKKNMELFEKALKGIDMKDAVAALEIIEKMVSNIR